MNVDLPNIVNLLGVNPLITPEQVAEIRALLEAEGNVLSRLNAEIQQASVMLDRLSRERDTLHHKMMGRSHSQTWEIERSIMVQRRELGTLEWRRGHIEKDLERLREQGDPHRIYEDLSAEIRNKEDKLQENQRRILQVQAFLDAQRNILSPIRRIPVELLAEIFRYSILCRDDYAYSDSNVIKGPLLLTAVCATWRTLALTTPSLWASISVDISPDKCRPSPELIKLWIERSSNHPLSFSIKEHLQLELFATTRSEICSKTILPYFIPSYARWRRVKLDYLDWRMTTGLETLPEDAVLSSLQYLELGREYWVSAEARQLCQILSAPNLRDFTWYSRSAPVKPLAVIEASQLTRICISRPMSRDEYFDVLTRCPVLQSADIFVQLVGLPADDPTIPLDTSLIHLPNLMEFCLTSDTSIEGLFRRIVAPALETLRVTRLDEFFLVNTRYTTDFWSQEEISGFLGQSRCALKMLEIRDGEMSGEDLMQVLKECNDSLRELMLTNERSTRYSLTDDVVRALTPVVGEECLCPEMDLVKLWRCVNASDGLLSDMIEARRKPFPASGVRALRLAVILLPDEHGMPTDVQRLKVMHAQRNGITLVGQ